MDPRRSGQLLVGDRGLIIETNVYQEAWRTELGDVPTAGVVSWAGAAMRPSEIKKTDKVVMVLMAARSVVFDCRPASVIKDELDLWLRLSK